MRSHMPLCMLDPQTHALQESSMHQTFVMLPYANVIWHMLLLSSDHRCHHSSTTAATASFYLSYAIPKPPFLC